MATLSTREKRASGGAERAPDATTLVCVACGGPLGGDEAELRCEACGVRVPLVGRVPVFCEGEPFYEEYAEEHIPYVGEPPRLKRLALRVLPYWSWREWRFFHKHLPAGDAVLDLGWGRGREWFTVGTASVAGIDPCLTALTQCEYDTVAAADIGRLPFADAVFDCAVTSDVLGHIPFDEKDAALSEMARVLKPGGRSVHVIETDSRSVFASYGKRDPELYRRNFIETDGQIGLELPSAVLERFRRNGFDIADVRKMESGPIWPRYYEKYLSKGYPERDPRVRRRISRWQRIRDNPLLLAACEVAWGFYHAVIEPHRGRLDDAMFLSLCAVKRA